MFPGVCDLCGGPQVWTLRGDEVWSACQLGCQLELFEGEEILPPLAKGDPGFNEVHPPEGTLRQEGSSTLVGGDAKTSEDRDRELPF